jgi:hypothetical protein
VCSLSLSLLCRALCSALSLFSVVTLLCPVRSAVHCLLLVCPVVYLLAYILSDLLTILRTVLLAVSRFWFLLRPVALLIRCCPFCCASIVRSLSSLAIVAPCVRVTSMRAGAPYRHFLPYPPVSSHIVILGVDIDLVFTYDCLRSGTVLTLADRRNRCPRPPPLIVSEFP